MNRNERIAAAKQRIAQLKPDWDAARQSLSEAERMLEAGDKVCYDDNPSWVGEVKFVYADGRVDVLHDGQVQELYLRDLYRIYRLPR